MFTRRASQKPTDDLYKSFKASFPQFNQALIATTAPSLPGETSLTDALDVSTNARPLDSHPHNVKDENTALRASHDAWNFGPAPGLTPSVLDPNSNTFHMMANQLPGYYTPTPGGTSTLYHNQAGDLHTPGGFGMGIGTPLSLPTSEGALHAGHQAAAFQGFQAHLPQHIHPQQPFQHVNPYQMHQPQGFAPHHFTHQPSFDQVDGPMEESPIDDLGMSFNMHHHVQNSPEVPFHSQTLQDSLQAPPPHVSGEKFRYHCTLNAPTAMVKHADEIPITYLNKGQAYVLHVADMQRRQAAPGTRYRTFVRVSFEDEQQRQRPAACWQLWKEGRGTNEAHQRAGRLQAVEYVEPSHMGGMEDLSRPRIELESSSFDGFCVNWSPSHGTAECPIQVRFNFLSTDFSHSKGVKGIPVRLCAKTEAVTEPAGSAHTTGPEVCYCKVKLFRDHGAERKLSNDNAHVRKTIEKLQQQIAQIESGMRDLGKRKRSGSVAKGPGLENRPGKVPKHRRTWSMSSVTSATGRGSGEDDLHVKLHTLQDMFSSTRPQSILFLRGAPEDDPDLHPVKLFGEAVPNMARTESGETSGWEQQSSNNGPPSSNVSPTPSLHSPSAIQRDPHFQQPTPFGSNSRVNSSEWRTQTQTATMDLEPVNPQHLASPPQNQPPIKIQTRSPTTGTMSGWIEAVGVDQTYRPPPERAIRPAACFYVQPRVVGRLSNDSFYRAIYLYNRTLKDFINAVAMKCNIEPTQVMQTLRITRKGMHVLFDDECIQELPEGQDMTAEFCEIQAESPMKPMREWDAGPTDIQCDGDLPTVENVNTTGFELRLLF